MAAAVVCRVFARCWKLSRCACMVGGMTPDPNTAIGLGLVAVASQDAIKKLLGPTADYFGQGLKHLAERSCNNINRIVAIAANKSGDRLSGPGGVNSRVLNCVIQEGVFCEDELIAEYLGGVLASSRTADGKDDRGVCFLNDIKSLSSYQLRTHYLVYSAITKHGCQLATDPKSWYSSHGHDTITLTFTDDSYLIAMNCEDSLQKRLISKHSFLGLEARQLLSGGIDAFEEWDEEKAKTNEPWRFCWPTPYGHELFAWGLGLGDTELTSYFDIPADRITDILPVLQVTKLELGQYTCQGKVRTYQ